MTHHLRADGHSSPGPRLTPPFKDDLIGSNCAGRTFYLGNHALDQDGVRRHVKVVTLKGTS